MLDILAGTPLLTVFLVVALGTALGAIPFGPLRFGAAGALFVGLALGALDPRLGEGLALAQSIGLTLFVYTIGVAAGPSFFRDLRRQAPLMGGATVLVVVFGLLAVVAGTALDLGPGITGGLFSGSLTATPAMAAASDALGGSTDPAVGYAISYPIAVVVTLLVLSRVARTDLPARRDPAPLSAAGLLTLTVDVTRPRPIADIPGIAFLPGEPAGVRVSYLLRDGAVTVADPDDALRTGDRVLLVGVPDAVRTAADALGTAAPIDLADDHSVVTYRRFVLSDHAVAGATVADLRIPARFGGVITRVRRGDRDLLAQHDMTLQLGDRIRVVFPRERLGDLRRMFGDSERRVTEVDFLPFGLGIAIGVAVGLVAIPLGGGASLALGSAAGPLVVGLVLGRLGRTGPLVWTMPLAANLTIRQFGLMFFLATVGLASGQAFGSTAFTATGLAVALSSVVLLLVVLALFALLGRLAGLSTARTAGAMAGFIGQPVLLGHVTSIVDDDRAESGYSALFALAVVVKIVVVQGVVAL
ncbi:aspartate:alanine exchanger family transporter [Georgenia sp. Z1344]|uniref:aspartate:alanine exchanger family transporter n=1 Tax=Georgenia sp. Z1344 TaxID=3416706 RepID=UPI003CEB8FD4